VRYRRFAAILVPLAIILWSIGWLLFFAGSESRRKKVESEEKHEKPIALALLHENMIFDAEESNVN
jgi:uncharacterized membrane protein